MLYLFCWQLVWWAIIFVFSSASFISFCYIFISVSVFKIIFTKAFNFLPRNEMNKNQLILYVTEIYLCTIYTKQNLIFRDLVQFQVCRWFHAPSNTDCLSYELNKIFYFQRSAAWPHFLPMICVYQYLCISKSFAVHKYIVCYFMFCSFYSLVWKDLWIVICTVFVEKCSVYHGRKSLKYTVLKSFQFMAAA